MSEASDPRRVRRARRALLAPQAASFLEQVSSVLCDEARAQIVRALTTGPLSVTDLVGAIDRSRTATSQHLRVLRDAGIVVSRRRGRRVFYAITAEAAALTAIRALDIVVEAVA